MSNFLRVAAAAAVVLVVGLGLVWYLGGRAAPGPASTPTPSPSPTPISIGGYTLSSQFQSDINGFEMAYPTGWETRKATVSWQSGFPHFDDEFNDVMFDKSQPDLKFIGVSSQPLGELSGSDWIEAKRTDPDWEPACLQLTEPITVDGQQGEIQPNCPDGLMAVFVPVGDRGYMIVLYGVGYRSVFDALLTTVRFHPEQALQADAPGPRVPSN
jgi:hypothetical protein